jgi:phosphoribosyl-dephospho-CoA transferase
MALNPHDLIQVGQVEYLVCEGPMPAWAVASIRQTPWVVVRRAQERAGWTAVGIRGEGRGQRCAAWLPLDRIQQIVTPYMLANSVGDLPAYIPMPVISTLRSIAPLLSGYRWGPTGSLGFQLASGRPVLHAESDLDLLISTAVHMSHSTADVLLRCLEMKACARIDVQLDTPVGGVSLREYCRGGRVLVKTTTGPILKHIETLWL